MATHALVQRRFVDSFSVAFNDSPASSSWFYFPPWLSRAAPRGESILFRGIVRYSLLSWAKIPGFRRGESFFSSSWMTSGSESAKDAEVLGQSNRRNQFVSEINNNLLTIRLFWITRHDYKFLKDTPHLSLLLSDTVEVHVNNIYLEKIIFINFLKKLILLESNKVSNLFLIRMFLDVRVVVSSYLMLQSFREINGECISAKLAAGLNSRATRSRV